MQVSVTTVPARWVAYRWVSTTWPDVGAAIQLALGPIYGVPGVRGTPFARYVEVGEDGVRLQAGVLLREPVQPVGDIHVDYVDAVLAVYVEFFGPYPGRESAHRLAEATLASIGKKTGGKLWEVFDGPPDDDGNAKVKVYLPIEPVG